MNVCECVCVRVYSVFPGIMNVGPDRYACGLKINELARFHNRFVTFESLQFSSGMQLGCCSKDILYGFSADDG